MAKFLLLVVAALLMGCGSADMRSLAAGSGANVPACPPAGNPTPDGYYISPANTSCYLKPLGSFYFNFPGSTKIQFPGDTTNYQLDFDSTNTAGTSAVNANSGHLFKSTFWPFGTTWQQYVNAANFYWAISPGVLTTPSFKNITSGVNYYSFSTMRFSNGDTIQIAAPPPARYTYWPANANEQIAFNQTGVTINLDPGANFYALSGATGNGAFDIGPDSVGGGSGTSIIGDAGTPALIQGSINLRTNATPILLQNLTVQGWGGTLGCNATCIHGGGGDQLATLGNILVQDGGGSGGQEHNIYLGIFHVAPATDVSCYFLNNVTSINVVGESWTIKLRGCNGGSTPHDIGTVNNTIAGCATSVLANCNQNGAIDFPCSGNWRITNSVLNVGQGAQSGAQTFYISKYGEEDRVSPVQCSNMSASVNTINLDNVIAIFDAACCAGLSNPVLVCTYADPPAGTACGDHLPTGMSCTISNSVLVGNGVNQLLRGAACSDGGGNRSYLSRTAAATGEGWSGTDHWGNPCCSFPWLPPHP